MVFLAVFALGFVTDTLFIRMMNPPDELADQAEDPYEPVVVLELYTSQGCSSCPATSIRSTTTRTSRARITCPA